MMHCIDQGLSLKLFYRMFRAHGSLTTREVYTCLCEHLHHIFGGGGGRGEDGYMFTLAMGLDPADDRCLEMLSKVGVVGGGPVSGVRDFVGIGRV